MKIHDYDTFTAILLFIVSALFLHLSSCSVNKHSHTTSQTTNDDKYVSIQCDVARNEHQNTKAVRGDTTVRTENVAGSLKIERDTAGRPILLIWNANALLQSSSIGNFDGSSLFFGNYSGSHQSTATENKKVIDEEKEAETKLGAPWWEVLLRAVFFIGFILVSGKLYYKWTD